MAYNPRQPRVPKGSGDPSGQWASAARKASDKQIDKKLAEIDAQMNTMAFKTMTNPKIQDAEAQLYAQRTFYSAEKYRRSKGK
jgi:hypothetical protein